MHRPPPQPPARSSSYPLRAWVRQEQRFLAVLGVLLVVAAGATPFPEVARWVGFVLAAYATIANDSIQTIGTFLSSNRHRSWWLLWLFTAGIFAATVAWSWATLGGDVSYGRLAAKGFAEAPVSFNVAQVVAPVVLLLLTRLRMPVSTTFLLLSIFATDPGGVQAVLTKSLLGYGVAFVVAVAVWVVVARWMRRVEARPAHPLWVPAQWASTGFLWSTWIMQDAANLAVYLPRTLSGAEFAAFTAIGVGGLGWLCYTRGGRIQQVVEEKSDMVDLRAATTLDFVYALILYVFKELSAIPMSTTWVFIGLLAGRELMLSLRGASDRPLADVTRLASRDLARAAVGLIVSILLALVANPVLRVW